MDGEAIQAIQDSVRKEAAQVYVKDQLFSTKDLKPVIFDPHPAALSVGTLAAIKDYLAANVDRLTVGDIMLHVENERGVTLMSKIDGPNRVRDKYLTAAAEAAAFRFGEFMDPESFVIGLQTAFHSAVGDIEVVMKAAGNLREGKERTVADNGVSQEVTAKVGVQVGIVTLPSPVSLSPWRTFREVDQPSSLFIFRARAGSDEKPPMLALFIADGNRWKLDAIKNVADWLRKEIPAVTVLA